MDKLTILLKIIGWIVVFDVVLFAVLWVTPIIATMIRERKKR